MSFLFPDFFDCLFKHFGHQAWWPAQSDTEIIIGAILTQNTSWSNVEKALENLRGVNGICFEYLYKIDETSLATLIKPSGYFNQKAKKLKEFSRFIVENYDGSIMNLSRHETEELRNRLLSVKGIGNETADDILLYVFKRPVFVIDAYTRRFAERHLSVDANIMYDDLRQIFEETVPKEYQLYQEFHALIVRLAKMYCRKRTPLCEACPVIKIHKPLIPS